MHSDSFLLIPGDTGTCFPQTWAVQSPRRKCYHAIHSNNVPVPFSCTQLTPVYCDNHCVNPLGSIIIYNSKGILSLSPHKYDSIALCAHLTSLSPSSSSPPHLYAFPKLSIMSMSASKSSSFFSSFSPSFSSRCWIQLVTWSTKSLEFGTKCPPGCFNKSELGLTTS